MKETIKYVFCVFLSCYVLTAGAQNLVSQQKFKLPVLKGKDLNPVLRLVIEANDGDQFLREVSLNGAETTDLNDISGFSLLALEQDSSFVSGEKLQKAIVFANTPVDGSHPLTLKGNAKLKAGTNYFWLVLNLKPQANLFHFIGINISSVTINQKQTIVKPAPGNFTQRIGIAVRQHNQDQVNTHRIPGLATASDGSLLAVYDARYDSARDLQGNIDIGLSRSTDHGKTWLPMQIIMDMGTWGGLPEKFNGVSDACILADEKTGAIYVAGLWMYGVLDEHGKWTEGLTENSKDWNHQWRAKGSQPGFDVKQTAQFLIVKSTDQGKTWSKPVNITKMCKQENWWLLAPAPGRGITLKDGTLVFPTQGRDATGRPFSNITYSKDGGQTWTTSKAAAAEETTENMAVELTDGTLMLNMRANANRSDSSGTNGRAIAISKDLGETWTEHPTSHKALQEPTCMASIIRHDYTENGRKKSILVFCNPDAKTARKNMTLKVSYDDGKTWPVSKNILLDEQKSRGYSCLTSVDNETIGVLYESSQADLVFQAIKLNELL